MNSSATKVAEIFTAAGQAFNRLGELTMNLPNEVSPSGSKWTDEEIEMLHSSILRFSEDLSKISLRIKNRTVSQIRQNLKKKAYEEAGIAVKQVPVQNVQQLTSVNTSVVNQQPIQSIPQTIHIQAHPHQTLQGQTVTVQQMPQLKTITAANSEAVVVDTNSWTSSATKSGDMMMTLNRLNTQEVEVDGEGLTSDGVKLEFTTEEEVTG